MNKPEIRIEIFKDADTGNYYFELLAPALIENFRVMSKQSHIASGATFWDDIAMLKSHDFYTEHEQALTSAVKMIVLLTIDISLL